MFSLHRNLLCFGKCLFCLVTSCSSKNSFLLSTLSEDQNLSLFYYVALCAAFVITKVAMAFAINNIYVVQNCVNLKCVSRQETEDFPLLVMCRERKNAGFRQICICTSIGTSSSKFEDLDLFSRKPFIEQFFSIFCQVIPRSAGGIFPAFNGKTKRRLAAFANGTSSGTNMAINITLAPVSSRSQRIFRCRIAEYALLGNPTSRTLYWQIFQFGRNYINGVCARLSGFNARKSQHVDRVCAGKLSTTRRP